MFALQNRRVWRFTGDGSIRYAKPARKRHGRSWARWSGFRYAHAPSATIALRARLGACYGRIPGWTCRWQAESESRKRTPGEGSRWRMNRNPGIGVRANRWPAESESRPAADSGSRAMAIGMAIGRRSGSPHDPAIIRAGVRTDARR